MSPTLRCHAGDLLRATTLGEAAARGAAPAVGVPDADRALAITSYASIFHKPGEPLFDLCAIGRAQRDPRIYFSWYAADYTTDPDFAAADPERHTSRAHA